MAEMRGEASVVVPVSPDVVYAYVSDFKRHIEWNHQPQKMTQTTDGPAQVGTRYRTEEQSASNANWFVANVMIPFVNLLLGVASYTESEITELVQDQRVAWTASAPRRGGYLMKADWEIDLTPYDNGTKVTQHFHFMPQHWIPDRVADDNMAKSIEMEVASNLENLKALVASV